MPTRLLPRPRICFAACFALAAVLHLSGSVAIFGQDFENEDCLECHSDAELTRDGVEGEDASVFVDGSLFAETIHGGFSCLDCHEGIADLPHEEDLPPVSCGDCHDDASEAVGASVHTGDASREPVSCTACHGDAHAVFPSDDSRSDVYVLNVYRTCGACHFEQPPPEAGEAAPPLSFERFQDDIHGRGIVKAGLVVSASCVSCHGGHGILPSQDPDSRVSHENVITTCGACHVGNVRDFMGSTHGRVLTETPDGPTCVTCHRPHEIRLVDEAEVLAINRNCAECHDSRAKSYSRTYHGKVNALGYSGVATCDKCHRMHLTLPAEDPMSSVNPANKVATCAECHPDANESFASYVVHVDLENLDEYPVLHWTELSMRLLLAMVFLFFGVHSALWLRRSLQERRAAPPSPPRPPVEGDQSYFLRLKFHQRLMHGVVIVSFLGLALTGLPLKFSDSAWAGWIMTLLGGFRFASLLHRVFAVLTFAYFLSHVGHIAYSVLVQRKSHLLWGPDSMVPQPRDVLDLFGVLRWLFGKGEKPRFDRWAYWEKFDYWAVFWGVAVIGTSGLIMAFPVFFTRFLPGRAINLALIVHSDEALLAVGFIFAIHFFNTHLKPEKYPVDMTFYTGRTALDEYEKEHPLEVERLRARGRLEERLRPPPRVQLVERARRFGFTAVGIGLTLLLLIIAAAIFP